MWKAPFLFNVAILFVELPLACYLCYLVMDAHSNPITFIRGAFYLVQILLKAIASIVLSLQCYYCYYSKYYQQQQVVQVEQNQSGLDLKQKWKSVTYASISSFAILYYVGVLLNLFQRSLSMTLVNVYFLLVCLLSFYGVHRMKAIKTNPIQQEEREEEEKKDDEEKSTLAARNSQELLDNMKNMMGNVAHDLKTPLASFMTGLETLQKMLLECKVKLDRDEEKHLVLSSSTFDDSSSSNVSSVKMLLSDCLECLSSMSDTNAFMLMNIHRCIDYVKASKDLKLTPKYETVYLLEAISLPLQCMKNIQQRVSINFLPIQKDICSHVITDKQWLQENVLCLLSNAVKYSNGGSVQVKISLEKQYTCSNDDHKVVKDSKPSNIDSLDLISPSFSQYSHGGNSVARKKIHPDPDQPTEVAKSVTVLRVEVEDEGIGMSEQAMTSLFSAFKQNQHLAGGTGLGLFSLAKRMEALQGRCGVSKRRDGKRGSLFWFQFPYREDVIAYENWIASQSDHNFSVVTKPGMIRIVSHGESYDEKIDSVACSLSAPTVEDSFSDVVLTKKPSPSCHSFDSFKDMKVLLVEDSPSISKITSMLLRKSGFQVEVAENGAEALDKIQSSLRNHVLNEHGVAGKSICCDDEDDNCCLRAFDYILMDLQMPVMDGLEATRRLRDFENHGNMKCDSCPFINNTNYIHGAMEKCSCSSDFMCKKKVFHHKVIGVSANEDEETQKAMVDIGFDACLSKPFSMVAFTKLISTIDQSPL
eukprot:scaffold1594_cov171-Ochromonas_danica.AAC.15